MRCVSCAITARMAVEERASKECLRHQGYASAIQNASNPACSQALAMATVSCTGSMLNCRTPILNGMVIENRFLLLHSSTTLKNQLCGSCSQFSDRQSGSFH